MNSLQASSAITEDDFVAEVNAAGALAFSTCLGNNIKDVFVDGSGIAYVTGSAGATQATWGWQQNNESPTAQTGYFSEFAGGSWFAETGTTPAFTVSGTPYVPPAPGVPEPRSYALLLAAAFMGILILRRRRNAAA